MNLYLIAFASLNGFAFLFLLVFIFNLDNDMKNPLRVFGHILPDTAFVAIMSTSLFTLVYYFIAGRPSEFPDREQAHFILCRCLPLIPGYMFFYWLITRIKN